MAIFAALFIPKALVTISDSLFFLLRNLRDYRLLRRNSLWLVTVVELRDDLNIYGK